MKNWKEDFRKLYFNWKKNNDFFECVLLPFVEKLLASQKEDVEELMAHRTAEGYCCACDYDMVVFQGKLRQQLEEIEEFLFEGEPMTQNCIERKDWEEFKKSLI